MKSFIAFCFLAFPAIALAAPSDGIIVTDGVVSFPQFIVTCSTFNGGTYYAFSAAERDQIIAKLTASGHLNQAAAYVPDPTLVAISSSVFISNFSDLRRYMSDGDKVGLRKLLRRIYRDFQNCQDDNAAVAGSCPEQAALRQAFGIIGKRYQELP